MRKSLFVFVPALAMFLLGGWWNAVLAPRLFSFPVLAIARQPGEVRLGLIAAAYALLTALMAFLFARSFPAKPGGVAGFQFGALFGVIMTVPVYLLLAAVWNVSLGALLVDAGWHGIEQGLGGVLMAALFVPKVSPNRSTPSP